MKVIFAYGSTRPQSVGQKVLKAMARSAVQAGHEVLDMILPSRCRDAGAALCAAKPAATAASRIACTIISTSFSQPISW